MKGRIKKNYDKQLKIAHSNDMRLSEYRELLSTVNELKRTDRLQRRYGSFYDWESADPDEIMGLMIPIVLNVKNEITSYLMVTEHEQVPDKYKYLILETTGINITPV